MGLTIIQALSDEFSIRSVVGMGTKLYIKKEFVSSLQDNYGITNF